MSSGPFNLATLVVLSAALWLSTFLMLGISMVQEEFQFLKIIALVEALAATVFTVMATRKWLSGG